MADGKPRDASGGGRESSDSMQGPHAAAAQRGFRRPSVLLGALLGAFAAAVFAVVALQARVHCHVGTRQQHSRGFVGNLLSLVCLFSQEREELDSNSNRGVWTAPGGSVDPECLPCEVVAEDDDMSAHAKRLPETAAILSAQSHEDFQIHLSRPGLRVFDDYSKFAGPCEPMANIFKRLKLDYGDGVYFIQAPSDTISAFETMRNQSCPAFLFFFNGLLVKMVRGANAPLIERTVREQVELEKAGLPHPPLALDETTRPFARFLGVESVSESGEAAPSASNPLISQAGGAAPMESRAAEALADKDDGGPAEQTLAILKPEVMVPSTIETVNSALHHNRFQIAASKRIWLTKEGVAELFKEHEGRDYFPRLLEYMSSGPVLVMQLSKANAIKAWRVLLGPKGPKVARQDAPKSLRAQFGTDSLMNGFHASDGPISVARELEFFFPPPPPVDDDEAAEPTPAPLAPLYHPASQDAAVAAATDSGLPQKTLAVIKPDVAAGGADSSEAAIDAVVQRALPVGIQVLKRETSILAPEQARLLVEAAEWARPLRAATAEDDAGGEENEGVETERALIEQRVEEAVAGPSVSMVLNGENVVARWNELMGPEDPAAAKESAPMSIRAVFGTDVPSRVRHADLRVTQIFESRRTSTTAGAATRHSVAGSKASIAVHSAAEAAAPAVAAVLERTLALIKPDVYPDNKDAIVAMIEGAGFAVIEAKETTFLKEVAREFYREHEGKGFFDELTEVSPRGHAPIYALVLEKEGAVAAWRALAGPTNSEMARETAPESVRACFGTDGSQNAVHGSDSPASAAREIAVVFGDTAAGAASASAAPAAEKAPAPTPPAGSARALVAPSPARASSTSAGAALRRASKPASAAGGGSKAASAKGGSAAVSARLSKAASRSESAERAPGADAAAAPLAGAGNAPDGEAAA
ncbi:Thioredoxin domain-containing protein 3 [Cladochytrium tenue]|nr:Thioredoxin domain-containing protein 3 [Cladochytrium tenue]